MALPSRVREVSGLPSDSVFIRVLRDHASAAVGLDEEGFLGLTPAELEDETGLSRPSVVALLKRFENVLEAQDSHGAPAEPDKARRWALNLRQALAVGVDIGQAHVSVAVSDLGGRIHKPETPQRYELRKSADPEATLDWIAARIQGRLKELKRKPEDVVGVGIAIGMPVDPEGLVRDGLSLGAELHPDWQLVGARDHLRRRLGWDHVPFLVDNDANLSALAEYSWGAGRPAPESSDAEYENVVYVEWSRGIGAGLIIGGDLYRGGGIAGEVGHTVVQEDGPKCPICGNQGCLETVAGWKALSALIPGGDDLPTALGLAREGNNDAVRAFDDAAQYLARALGPVINLLNPQLVVIGGAIGQKGYDVVGPPLKRALRRYTIYPALKDVAVVGAELSEGRTALQGALAISLRHQQGDPDVLGSYLLRRAAATQPHKPAAKRVKDHSSSSARSLSGSR